MRRIYLYTFLGCSLASCSKDLDNRNEYVDEPVPPMAASDTVTTSTANFKGVNWADPRDNFIDEWIILSGLSITDDGNTISSKTETILSAFRANGANTVRLPINPSTVLQNWWPKYSSVINQAAAKGMKVILAYWEGASSKDGLIDNTTDYLLMWDRVVAKYISNQNIYFEVFNEPHGYNIDDLKNVYADWLSKYPSVPKRRILLDGGGYATDVNSIGADSRFDSCLLSFHFYTWFAGGYQTTADWELPVKGLHYTKRTVMTEFGVPMIDGKMYAEAPAYDSEVNYMKGITGQLHDSGIGSVYWPGLRTDDSYSMFSYDGSSITVNNAEGLSLLQYSWGSGTTDPFYAEFTPGAYYKIVNRNSNKSLDVNGGSLDNGGSIIQSDYSGVNNQQWGFITLDRGYFSVKNKNSNKFLDVNGASTDGGAGIIQWDYSGGATQQWQITNIGFGYYKIINRNSSQSLDVNQGATWNGGDIIQWYWNNGYNQQWHITEQ